MEILSANEFGIAKLEDIIQFENFNKIHLPEDYRQFLLTYNGGKPSPSLIPNIAYVDWIYPINGGPHWINLLGNIDIYQNRIPSWYFPFACDIADNQFLMSLYEENYGTIAFWDHEREAPKGEADQYFDNMEFVADSFTEFLNMLTDAPENEEV